MKSLRVLDVTLRDGGCVNDFNFGQDYIEKILFAEEAAGIDIIEMGYIDKKRGSVQGRTQYKNEQIIPNCILLHKLENINYVAMMDYGKFDANDLKYRSAEGIDGLRLAFHKENCHEAIKEAKTIIEKGYELYIQPMVTLRYSDSDLLELINDINREIPNASAFYIVDSFGEMRPNDMSRVLNLIDHNLIKSMPIGFHSHNNLQLSYSNAMEILQFPTNRSIILDCSIMGMGKGAGNLNTELLLEHLNLFYGKKYNISPLLKVMDEVINQIHDEFYWGYSPEYYLSSINHCSPSYASYFYNKHMLSIDQVSELLGMIADEKKISFDREYAEILYREYNETKIVDDSKSVEELKRNFKDKTILLIAPGKSIIGYRDRIEKLLKQENVISIGLNTTGGFMVDYSLVTRIDVFEKMCLTEEKLITTSHISKGKKIDNVITLDYKKWIEVDEKTHDSSAVIALNLLDFCNANEILIAGMDGFSTDINNNYADPSMRRPVSSLQANSRNAFYKDFIENKKNKGLKIFFVTPSKYGD